MDQANHTEGNQPYYYPSQSILYTPDVYLPDASTSAHEQAFSQHIYHQQQVHYPYQRYPRHSQLSQQLPPQQPRPHSHPQQGFHQQLPSSMQHHHEQLRHAHSQPSLPRVSPTLHHPSAFEHAASPSSHTTRSSSSESPASYHSDPLSSLRDDLQVHAAATALAQAAGPAGDHYAASAVPRLPPIHDVLRTQVTTTATQAASASRRRNEATFRCPVPGCGSTFTRRFNLKGHLRSHTSERPFICEWPGCGKGFARQHDCKRHYQLHSAKTGTHMCRGCGKSFSRTDALNRHLRSEGGLECRLQQQAASSSRDLLSVSSRGEDSASPGDSTDGTTSGTTSRSRPSSI